MPQNLPLRYFSSWQQTQGPQPYTPKTRAPSGLPTLRPRGRCYVVQGREWSPQPPEASLGIVVESFGEFRRYSWRGACGGPKTALAARKTREVGVDARSWVQRKFTSPRAPTFSVMPILRHGCYALFASTTSSIVHAIWDIPSFLVEFRCVTKAQVFEL